MSHTPIRDLFLADVTRDIPPVVYFKDQEPHKLQAEVDEYIITGGWPEDHPNRRRVGDGIHEQYVRLLTRMAAELDKPGGPELPNVWISGFYGSGKSSFAKLLGMALDGVALPDGRSMAQAWLQRDTSPRASELRAAWKALRAKIDPIAVVFDVGGVAGDNEHIHAVCVRQVQERLGYSNYPHVAELERKLEADGSWDAFEAKAQEVLGEPWATAARGTFPGEDCSRVLAELYPERFKDDDDWFDSRAGTRAGGMSPEEAVAAIGAMVNHRRPGATVFLVVDEVSQYVLSDKDRVDRLRAFASALGSTLGGRAWLLALGQQSLDEKADKSFLVWARDRFPPHLRVHLAPTNIRDVVHKRLLQKRPEAQAQLRALFHANRENLKLDAYDCRDVTPEEFVEFYPMLPGQFDLLLRITSALRLRSRRAQGDDQAIRGLLQLLGELFRAQKLAEMPVGALVTLDQIYEVQHTALDADTQASMARILHHCAAGADPLQLRAAKAVALLELIQDVEPTTAALVSQCLYDRLDRGGLKSQVSEALEALRRDNLLGYSEKSGYKIQSSAGEEWERERRDVGVPTEAISAMVQERLRELLGGPERPQLRGRPFRWAGVFSDGKGASDATLADPRDDAVVQVDFRFLPSQETGENTWVKNSAETLLENRLVWVAGDVNQLRTLCRQLGASKAMVRRYDARKESLSSAKKLLLQEEKNRAEDLVVSVTKAIQAAWIDGRLYFRGRAMDPTHHGAAFSTALLSAAERVLPDLFPHFETIQVLPSELAQLVQPELSGPSPKFMTGELGILSVDPETRRHLPSCDGVVPRRVLEYIEGTGGLGGGTLLTHFGGPPYGHTTGVVKACVAGLLRGGKLRVELETGGELTAIRDTGAKDLFDKEREFRRASFFPAAEDDISFGDRARICKLFRERLGHDMDREDHLIADAVGALFPAQARRLRAVNTLLVKLPGSPQPPKALLRLETALEKCLAGHRVTRKAVKLVLQHLDALRDGFQLLQLYHSELSEEAIRAVRDAHDVLTHHVAQLREMGTLDAETQALAATVEQHLAGERPWREVASLHGALETLRGVYVDKRRALLGQQEREVEADRGSLQSRDGFSILTSDDAHAVLRPLAAAATDTADNAVAPPLSDLVDPFRGRLARATEQAHQLLDEILSRGPNPIIVVVNPGLRHREVATEGEVKALVTELEERLMAEVRAGRRVRLE